MQIYLRFIASEILSNQNGENLILTDLSQMSKK